MLNKIFLTICVLLLKIILKGIDRNCLIKMVTRLIVGIIFLFHFSNIQANSWFQNDWSNGDSQLIWTDSTKYWSANNIEGNNGISLYKEDTLKAVPLPEGTEIRSIVEGVRGDTDFIFAGGGNTGIDIWMSSNNGETWIMGWKMPSVSTNYMNSLSLLWDTEGFLLVGMNDYSNGSYISKVATFGQEYWPGALWSTGTYIPIYSIIAFSDTILAGGGDANACILRSTDNGVNWASPISMPDNRIISLLKSSDGNVYSGSGGNLGLILKSTDNGTNWTAVFATTQKSVFSLIEAPDSTIYAGTGDNGKIFTTKDGWNTHDTTTPIPNAREVRLICDSLGTLYAGVSCMDDSARVFYSPDKGNSWVQIGGTLCQGKILSLMLTNNQCLLVGTDHNGTIFKLAKYASEGSLISSVYNTGESNKNSTRFYNTIEWNAENNGQDIVVKIRSFQDTISFSDTLPWTSCPPCTSGQLLSTVPSVDNNDQFIQYRIDFLASPPFIAPVLHNINTTYSFADTASPLLASVSATGDEIYIPPNSFIPNDKVTLSFDERINTLVINNSNIDSILKLSNEHTWRISSAIWDTAYKNLTITLSDTSQVMIGDTVLPRKSQIDSLTDKSGNQCVSPCIITGTFAPLIDSTVASDGQDSLEYIDSDDYLTLYFSKRTNKPIITSTNINNILHLRNHSWLDAKAHIDTCVWDSLGFTLACSLKTDSLRPTISVGDTVFPDSVTIKDKFSKGSVISPCVIKGTFGQYGPTPDSAIAYEGNPQETGIGNGDYILIYFNKLIKDVQWDLLNQTRGLDTVLTLRRGTQHTWYSTPPESLSCSAQAIEQQDSMGVKYTLLFISFTKQAIEENLISYNANLSVFPNPSSSQASIYFTVPGLAMSNNKNSQPNPLTYSSKTNPSISLGDTIFPNSNLIKDASDRKCKKTVLLTGGFKKSELKSLTLKSSAQKSQPVVSNSPVSIKIYNVSGQLVRTLMNTTKQAGTYTALWDGKDNRSHKVNAGMYICKLILNNQTLTQKIVFLK
ncbi:MAG: FlgD immunoglobulin-like domain containing protein [bacterium]|nr:FlgD immunoglobulin-like domain containing protein [bacterium]